MPATTMPVIVTHTGLMPPRRMPVYTDVGMGISGHQP
jgi:hypothetical protein